MCTSWTFTYIDHHAYWPVVRLLTVRPPLLSLRLHQTATSMTRPALKTDQAAAADVPAVTSGFARHVEPAQSSWGWRPSRYGKTGDKWIRSAVLEQAGYTHFSRNKGAPHLWDDLWQACTAVALLQQAVLQGDNSAMLALLQPLTLSLYDLCNVQVLNQAGTVVKQDR